MVFKGEDKHTKVVVVNCNCGCDEAIQIKKLVYDANNDEEYYLSILAGEFGATQRGIFRTIGHRIKLAFKMLFGKEYLLTEIVMTKEELEEYKKALGEL
jgi:hypothetical protein